MQELLSEIQKMRLYSQNMPNQLSTHIIADISMYGSHLYIYKYIPSFLISMTIFVQCSTLLSLVG